MVCLGNHVFLFSKTNYSKNSIITTFIQTVTYNSRFQIVSSFQFCVIFSKGNLVWHTESDHSPVQAAHINCLFNYMFYPQLTHMPSEQYHTSKLLALQMEFYQ